MKKVTALRIVCFLGLLVIAGTCFAQTIATFDVPNSTHTVPMAINTSGQIVGFYQDASGTHGFVRQPKGTIITFNLDPPGSSSVFATAVNDLGEITGYYVDQQGAHGFVRHKNGVIATFNVPNSPYPPNSACEWRTTDTYAQAINLTGQVAGVHRQVLVGISGVICSGLQYRGFLRKQNGSIITFGIFFSSQGSLESSGDRSVEYVGPHSINLLGQITGSFQYSDFGPPIGAFLRQRDGAITIFLADLDPPTTITYATAINLFAQITGSYIDPACSYSPCPRHGYLRQPNGNILTFDPTGSIDTEPNVVNDLGQIAGYYRGSSSDASHGFVRERDGAIVTFDVTGASTVAGEVLPPRGCCAPPWIAGGGTFPQDISLAGEVTGYYQDANFVSHGFVRSAR